MSRIIEFVVNIGSKIPFRKYWFWLTVTFVHRLFSITQAPLETAHNWRQTTVTMVARNFLEIDPNPFYPRVDMAGDLSGITGMEFPFLNYLIYLVSLVFGYEHWYGRLINLVITSLGLYAFHNYLKKYFNAKLAFNTGMALLFSLFYYYSRKIMPDTFSIALIFIGIWGFDQFLTKKNWSFFVLAFVSIFLGVASKLPAVVTLIFLWPVFKSANFKYKSLISSGLIVTALFSGWWYFSWVPHLEKTFGYSHFFMGDGMLDSFKFLIDQWPNTLRMIFIKPFGITGILLLLPGLYYAFKNKLDVILIILGSLFLFGLFMLNSGDRFGEHEYYVMPIIPLFAFLIGLTFQHLKGWIYILLLSAICIEGVTRKWEDQFIKNDAGLVTLEETIDPIIPKESLIVINSGKVPTPMYFAHRKGWITDNKKLQNENYIQSIKAKGCEYVIIMHERFGQPIQLEYPIVYQDEKLTLHKL